MIDITPEETAELRKSLGIEVHTHPPAGLITIGPISDDLEELLGQLPHEQREFLEVFRQKHTISATVRALGLPHNGRHYNWLKRNKEFGDVYRAAWKIVDAEVTDALEAANVDRALNGFREEMYETDDEGNEVLKSVKVKQDAAYLKMALIARRPEIYGTDRGANTINIQVLIVNE